MTEIDIESESSWWRIEIEDKTTHVADVYIAGNYLEDGYGRLTIQAEDYSLDTDARPPALFIEVAPWYSKPDD